VNLVAETVADAALRARLDRLVVELRAGGAPVFGDRIGGASRRSQNRELAALQAGAIGFLTKDAGRAEIARALQTAAAGQAVLDPHIYARLIARAAAGMLPATPDDPAVHVLPDDLTTREGQVLSLIADGLSNGQIAARLFVSEATIKTHINHIFTKAGLRDRAQAVAYAYRHRLV